MKTAPLVLFDGPCTLCQRSVRFILRHERAPDLMFASLQSETGKAALEKHQLPSETDKVVLIEEDSARTGSEAALNLCKFLKYPWRLFYPLRHLPSFMHQPLYTWITRHRYKWFGKDDSCPLPDPKQADRFLS